MTETVIHIDGALPLAVLDERGWTQGTWIDDAGHVCAHQAIRLCAPVPGDAHLIEQVAERIGRGTAWNDDATTTEDDVREWLGAGIDVTDADLAETFGPQWRAVVEVVRRAATLTLDEVDRLAAARDAARDAAWVAAWVAARDAAWDAARDAARDAAWGAARGAARDAARDAAWVAAWVAARDAAWDAARDAVVWDLATDTGPFTPAQRDLLMAPWAEVFGPPEGLLDEVPS